MHIQERLWNVCVCVSDLVAYHTSILTPPFSCHVRAPGGVQGLWTGGEPSALCVHVCVWTHMQLCVQLWHVCWAGK